MLDDIGRSRLADSFWCKDTGNQEKSRTSEIKTERRRVVETGSFWGGGGESVEDGVRVRRLYPHATVWPTDVRRWIRAGTTGTERRKEAGEESAEEEQEQEQQQQQERCSAEQCRCGNQQSNGKQREVAAPATMSNTTTGRPGPNKGK